MARRLRWDQRSTIRTDLGTAADLRRIAKRQGGRRTALRLLAIANALDGMSWAQAARAAEMERQSLCEAIKRFNAEGIAGLVDRPKGHRPEHLSEAEPAILVNRILRGPDPDRGDPSAWTLPDLCRFVEERFDKTMCPQSMSRVVRWLGLSRQKARLVHPQTDAIFLRKSSDLLAKACQKVSRKPIHLGVRA